MKKLLIVSLFLVSFFPSVSQAQSWTCECVLYLREVWQVPIHGDAIKQIPNLEGQKVGIGDVVLFNYNGVGHAALILKVTRTGFLIIEANYRRCEVTVREVAYNNKNIVGFYRPWLEF